MMFFISHFRMPELFNFFKTIFFFALWLVGFLSGQTSFLSEFSFIVVMMSFLMFLPMDIFWLHILVCGLSITLRYISPVVLISAGCLFKYFFQKAMEYLFLLVTNILGVASRGLTHPPPPLVFVKPSKKVTYSMPPSSF